MHKSVHKSVLPIPGLEPGYPAWKASMLTTYIISELFHGEELTNIIFYIFNLKLIFLAQRLKKPTSLNNISTYRIWTDMRWKKIGAHPLQKDVPIPGLEPGYPAWEASMITTYIISDSEILSTHSNHIHKIMTLSIFALFPKSWKIYHMIIFSGQSIRACKYF